MKFSKRVSQWPADANPITEALERLRKAGRAVIDLTQSNPTKCSFNYLTPGILAPLRNGKNLRYEPDPHGLLEGRKAICRYYADKGIPLEPEQIFITSGTSEAYSFLFRLLLDINDKILIPQPSYPLFDYLAGLNDAAVGNYSLVYENGWRIDMENFERQIQKGAKALIVLNPNNPTGNFISQKERERINDLCGARDLPVISDEVFLDFILDKKGVDPKSFAGNNKVLAFTLSGISKILGLPQMKLSWIVVNGPENLRREAISRLEIIADTYLSANTPSQRALAAWFKGQRRIHGEMRARFLENRDYLTEKTSKVKNIEILKCEGGWYSILKIRSQFSDEETVLRLLKEQGVLVYPGYFFDFEGEDYLVLSHLLPPERFRAGIDRLLNLINY